MYRIVLFPRKIFRIIKVSPFKTRSKLSTLVFNNLIPRSLSRSNRDLIDKNIALLSIEKPLTPPSNELWIYAEKLLELNLRKSSDICQRKCIPVKNYSHRIFSEYISSIKTDRIIKLNFFFFENYTTVSDIQEQIKRTSILKINSAYSIKYTYVAFQIDVKYKNTGKTKGKIDFYPMHLTKYLFRAKISRVDFKY